MQTPRILGSKKGSTSSERRLRRAASCTWEPAFRDPGLARERWAQDLEKQQKQRSEETNLWKKSSTQLPTECRWAPKKHL